ncbi:MAG: AraC family transcriptional regulator [Bacteroidota bacterium]
MKPALEHLPRGKDQSFVVKYFDYNYYPTPWHYHPELELVLVTESTGKRFIGNHISDFKPGNLSLLGPDIPHTYRNEDHYYEAGSTLRAKSIVVHFGEDSLGEDFLHLPEAIPVKKLLEHAAYGLEIQGETNQRVSEKLFDLLTLSGLKRWLCLVEILLEIANTTSDVTRITQAPYNGYNEKESTRLCNVLNWVVANLGNEITLDQAAAVAQMNPNAFSRFFSLRTRKTFSAFIKELRLNKAAKLLIESEMSVTQVCYDCGYNNISNFNRQFLNYYRMNPARYKKDFLQKI